ncbi:phage tail protein [Escherichia coli]|uniref:gp53-like domain-containing protein n=1 Tax=Escherichia coli TaxID=562 RepID=UPI00208DC847|nr:phage tail protein [Escherichia coli]
MANLPETPQWEDGIYQIEVSDPVLGGPDGITNRPLKQLASRTAYLKQQVEKGGSDLAEHIAAADPHTQYATKASPTFTGTPTAPTPAANDNSKKLVTTEFVARAIAALAGTAPETLDTLKELADALGNDPNFATTVLNKLAEKLAKDQNGADIPDPALFVKNLQLGEAAKRDVGTGNNQLPDMSAFGMSRNGQTSWDILPNGMIRQAGTVTLTPVGNFNSQVLGGVTYYTHYYRVNFPRQFPNAQIATLATLASYSYSTQATMAGKSMATHRDTDSGTDVSRTRFTVTYTTPNLGEIPTLHFEAIGY